MKKLVHVDGPEELRAGDVFGDGVVTHYSEGPRLYWNFGHPQSAFLGEPFRWHPHGFEVEREVPAEPVVWEGRIPIRNGCVQDPLADLLLRAANCHAKHRVSIEEIEE